MKNFQFLNYLLSNIPSRNYLIKKCCVFSTETKKMLSDWGLTLMDNAVDVNIRLMEEEKVIFANNRQFGVGPNADFGKYCTNNELLSVVNLHNWLLIHVKNDTKAAKAFVDCMEKNIRAVG